MMSKVTIVTAGIAVTAVFAVIAGTCLNHTKDSISASSPSKSTDAFDKIFERHSHGSAGTVLF